MFGILGAKWIPRVLADYGNIDDAWRIFTQSDAPGWAIWMKDNDTLLESFDDTAGGTPVSHNHIMFGDLSAWAFEYLAGIKIDNPGFVKWHAEPYLPDGVASFEVSHANPDGTECRVRAWREGGKPKFSVSTAYSCPRNGASSGNTEPNDWENTTVSSRNREPARVYSMPLADVGAALTDALEPDTPYRMSLNGKWRISWCGDPAQRPLDFWKPGFDDSAWSVIDVPSCVEMRGFGSPGYTNVGYPHANTPPLVRDRDFGTPDYNPVSSYRRFFTVPESWRGRDVFLRFDGVYSAYYIWVNGEEVGYSEDSALPGEFNITRHLKDGENLLAVEVYRWCDGSYLEDQDMFRFSGIYRDVSLFAVPKDGIADFHVFVVPDADYRDWTLAVRTFLRGKAAPVTAELYDAAFMKTGDLLPGGDPLTLSLRVPSTCQWSAESPYLYTLVLRSGDDIRSCRVGFKEVKIAGNTLLVNGRKIKFKGVNRHEHSAENGRSVSIDDMTADITLMKRFNIDTVRTSHYPDHHSWYDLCDRYGIYLVAEANVEGHEGCHGPNGLGKLPEWGKAIVERNLNHVANYRNHPSVAFWSLGNETAAGTNFWAAASAVRAADASRPVLYEHFTPCSDIDASMYPNVEWLYQRGRIGDGLAESELRIDWIATNRRETVVRQQKGKVYFLCEYAHSMGNALGNFQEYWDAFYSSDSLAGGCIWDWVDQAIWKDTDRIDPKTGRRVRLLAYGGDFDEYPNDGPFCCNGLIRPDRQVSAKLVEVGHVHRNLVVDSADAATGEAELLNRFGFTRADAFAGTWELLENGVRVDGGALDVPPVEPLSRGRILLPQSAAEIRQNCEYLYNVSFSLKENRLWAQKGFVVAHDQMPYGRNGWRWTRAMPDCGGDVSVREDAEKVTVTAGPTIAVFNRTTGTLCKLAMRGKTVLEDRDSVIAGPLLTCMRAFTDNDRWLRDGDPWKIVRTNSFYATGMTQLRYHAAPLKLRREGGRLCIESSMKVQGAKSGGFLHNTVWEFSPDGRMLAKNTSSPFGRLPQLPRLGTSWKLAPSLENMSWYGRGPFENYVDRKTGSFLGVWKSTVTGQYEPYVRPQDNGYKSDVRWVAFVDDDGNGVRFSGDMPMFVQALHYSAEDLEFARHHAGQERFDGMKPPRREVCLNLDIRQLGLGGASCGPIPMEKYRFANRDEAWTVMIEPVSAEISTVCR